MRPLSLSRLRITSVYILIFSITTGVNRCADNETLRARSDASSEGLALDGTWQGTNTWFPAC